MPIRNLKPPRYSEDPSVDRVFKQTYDDLNMIINAVNDFNNQKEHQGKAGGIRVTDKGLQYRDSSGWKTLIGGRSSTGSDEVTRGSSDVEGRDVLSTSELNGKVLTALGTDASGWRDPVDPTNAVIVAAVEAGTDSNTFTDADHTKLDGITVGISDGNVLAANDVVADDDFLRIDGTEVEGRSASEVKTDLSLGNVTNDAQLPIAGGIMLGQITLGGNPTNDLHVAPKQYVDTMLPLAGGTMTGSIDFGNYRALNLDRITFGSLGAEGILFGLKDEDTMASDSADYAASQQSIRFMQIAMLMAPLLA